MKINRSSQDKIPGRVIRPNGGRNARGARRNCNQQHTCFDGWLYNRNFVDLVGECEKE